jgi:hypothetical protein
MPIGQIHQSVSATERAADPLCPHHYASCAGSSWGTTVRINPFLSITRTRAPTAIGSSDRTDHNSPAT